MHSYFRECGRPPLPSKFAADINVAGTVVRWYLHTSMSIQPVPNNAWVVSLIHAMFMICIRLFCFFFLLFAFCFRKKGGGIATYSTNTSDLHYSIVIVLVKLWLTPVHSPPNPTVINIFTFRHRHHYLQYIKGTYFK